MREIKFRGKASHSGEWLFGYLINICGNYHILSKDDMREDGHHVAQDSDRPTWVDIETVGQYTGLYDKNGKEIYEGDIVSHPWKDPIFGDLVETDQFVHSTICFNKGAFVVNYRLQGEYIYLQDFVRLKCLEVVGNIHDNPELLKGGER